MKKLNERELACVLASLTFWQREGLSSAGQERDLATLDGSVEELNSEKIGELIKRVSEEGEDEAPTYSGMAEQLDDIVSCFSRNGEFNTHSAQLGTVEIRETAVELRDALQALSGGEALLSVMMQDVVGDYDIPNEVPEWKWVEENGSFAHRDNGQSGVWDFVLNLSRTFENVPAKLRKTIDKARKAGFGYVLFHQRC